MEDDTPLLSTDNVFNKIGDAYFKALIKAHPNRFFELRILLNDAYDFPAPKVGWDPAVTTQAVSEILVVLIVSLRALLISLNFRK